MLLAGKQDVQRVWVLGPSFGSRGSIFGHPGPRVDLGELGRVFFTRDNAIGTGMGWPELDSPRKGV